ncbi:hypothetical protein PV646_17075 [Streptomyces sp. ID05-26A]|nr:hypothetical protein [Streptomyces sp. ID05-26A]
MATATPALVERERRLRLVRLVEVFAAAGGITTLVACGYLADGPGPALVAVSGVALLVTASLTAQRIRRKVRYRVDRPNSALWLAGKIAALLAGAAVVVYVAWALDVPSLPRGLFVFAVVGSLLAVVNTHASRWTLLQIDATGVRLGQVHLPWPAVVRLELADAAPGLVEVGVRLAPGGDLAARTTVPAAEVDRIPRALAEFGDPALVDVVISHVGRAA